MQCARKLVDFADQLFERVVRLQCVALTPSNGEISFAKGGYQIGNRLKREDDVASQRGSKKNPGGRDADGDASWMPDDPVRRSPDQQKGDGNAGRARRQRHQKDALFIAQLHSQIP